jgi:hypothetical protein
MYRIRLYIVPEHEEDEEKGDLVDKASANGCWWDTVRGDGCVTVTHRAHKAKVKVTFSDSQQDRGQMSGRCREDRNNRVNTANKVRQSLSSTGIGVRGIECRWLGGIKLNQDWLHFCVCVHVHVT